MNSLFYSLGVRVKEATTNKLLFVASIAILLSTAIGALAPINILYIAALVALPFIPYILNPNAYFLVSFFLSSIYVKYLLFFVDGIAYGWLDNVVKCLFLFVMGLFMIWIGLREKKEIKYPIYSVFFLFSLIFMIIPVVQAASFQDAFYFTKITTPFLLFVSVLMFYDKIDWNKMYGWFRLLLFLTLIFSIYQVTLGEAAPSDVPRASGLTPSRNTFSMFMVMLFDFIFIINAIRKNNKLSFFDGILLVLIVLLDFIGFSRGAWAVMGGTILFLLIRERKFLLIAFLSSVCVGIAYVFREQIQLRLISGYGTGKNRSLVTDMLMEKGMESPLIGHGFGWSQMFMFDGHGSTAQPHNDFVRLFVDMGMLGLLLFLIPYILIMFRMLRIMFVARVKYVKTIAFVTILSVIQILSFMSVYNVIDMFYATTSYVWLFAAVTEMEFSKNREGVRRQFPNY
ncbi:O-antigen ligase family protein [Paenibacillus sp.]|uniref:O-antigen ligase family protein n=1 Tax=Paenibacillus sp. TaxID=58172 RepID=UPI002D397C1E|nr:O-antigen ligase family protein [Paenibacillus sp.]HZG84913.1 O-antigen ligase family protein [Paenibacillus sp.]